MRARVDAALTLDAREVPPKVVERLCRMLSFPNPRVPRSPAPRAEPGGELETVCFVEQAGGELRLPRGAIHVSGARRRRRGSSSPARTLACCPKRRSTCPRSASATTSRRQSTSSRRSRRARSSSRAAAARRAWAWGDRQAAHADAHPRPHPGPRRTVARELKDKLGIEAGLIGDGEERPRP